jgi:beta-glucosidase
MPTYDIINGPTVAGKPLEPVAAGYNAQLLGLLRKDYAYKGLVLSDWGITRDCTPACRAPSQPQTPNEIAMPWGWKTSPRHSAMPRRCTPASTSSAA